MGNRYKEEKPFAFYDPEQDRERQRQAPRNWSAPPVSPRGAAQQYPQGPEAGYNRPGLSPPPPREQPFGRYNPELDRERSRQGMNNSYSSGPPSRPLDSLGRAQGAPQLNGRGGAPEPGYGAAAGRGAPGAGLYPPQSNPEFAGRGGRYGDGEDGYPSARPEMPGRGAPLGRGRGGAGYGDPAYEVNGKSPRYGDGQDGHPSAASEMLGRGAPLERGRGGGYRDPAYDDDAHGNNPRYEENGHPVARPEFASVSRRGRGGGGYEDPAYDAHGNKSAYRDGDSGYPMARSEMMGRGASLGRGRGEDPAYDAHGKNPRYGDGEDGHPEMPGRRAPLGRGRGGYGDPAYDDDDDGNGKNPRHGEDSYPVTRPEFASVSGRGRGGGDGYDDGAYGGNRNKPMYGDGESGYAGARPERMPGRGAPFGRGQDSAVPPMGDGRYVYGGLRQPERQDFQEEYDAPPAPISSEYAHQVYASVFSDPVYGGAGQINSRAGYLEQPDDLRQVHRREDVLRHPDQF